MRSGYTVLELMIAIVASSFLMMGLGSSIFLASQFLSPANTSAAGLKASDAVHQLTEELRYATYVISRSSNHMEFVVNDITGDGADDHLKYEWTGTAGDPLLRSLNGGDAYAVVDNLQSLEFTSIVEAKTETFESPEVESGDVQFAEQYDSNSTNLSVFQIRNSNWIGQSISAAAFNRTALPANTTTWTISRAELLAQSTLIKAGTTQMRLRTATGSGLPSSDLLSEFSLAESTLSYSFRWESIPFVNAGRLNPADALTITAESPTYSPSANFLLIYYLTGDCLTTSDAGANWSLSNIATLPYRLFGSYRTPSGTTETINRNYLKATQLEIGYSSATGKTLFTEVNHLNSPELTTTEWEATFSNDPTQLDGNFDETADWQLTSGGTFNAATLSSGAWQCDGGLKTHPANSFTALTTIDVRMKATSTASTSALNAGAVCEIFADWSGTTAMHVTLALSLKSDGTQTLNILRSESETEETLLDHATGLTDSFVDVRCVLIPASDVFAVWADGVFVGSFDYTPFTQSQTRQYIELNEANADAEFDFVSIRVSE